MRTPLIAGNWKLNKTVSESLDLVKKIHFGLPCPGNVDVVVAPVFTALNKVADFLKDSYIGVCGQNVFFEDEGAFTGEVSAPLLKEAGADYVIIGHSERRQYFGETNETVNKRVKAALRSNLKAIVCVGEILEEREANQVEMVVTSQVLESLSGLSEENFKNIIMAYEPVWAIGTGKTATPEQAEEVHLMIRTIIEKQFGLSVSDKLRILYGGSVKPSNAKELLNKPNIDGALVGGASLKVEDFIGIIKAVY